MTTRSPQILTLMTLIFGCHADPAGEAVGGESCVLVRWEDGDTPYVDCGSGPAPVRLLEIDTPESGFDDNSRSRAEWQAKLWRLDVAKVTACGKRATERAREICPDGSPVELTGDARDKYDRRLAHMRCNGSDINQQLVAEGHAGRYPFPADPERPGGCTP